MTNLIETAGSVLSGIANSNPISAILNIIDKVIPDKKAAEQAKYNTLALIQNGELDLAKLKFEEAKIDNNLLQGQIAINQENAKKDSIYANPRTFIFWVVDLATAYIYLIRPLLGSYLSTRYNIVWPELNSSEILGLAGSLLGIHLIHFNNKFSRRNHEKQN
jgi:hypothetical protein